MSSGAKMPTKSPHHTEEDFLEVDKPLPGQSFCCVSFVSPEKTLMNKEQHMFYHYHQYVLQEYSKIFGELTDKILESGEDEVNVSEVVDLKKRMGRIFKANEVKYDAWKELVEDFKFRDGDKVDRIFDEMNNFETSVRGVKVRGVYDSYREAEVRAKVLQRMDNRFDVFVGQVGYWLPWNPCADKIEDEKFLNNGLNELKEIQIIGPDFSSRDRTPTISFVHKSKSANQVCKELAKKNISAWDGHFYAKRAIQKLGLEKRGGVTRLGISIYNTSTEVKKTIEILSSI